MKKHKYPIILFLIAIIMCACGNSNTSDTTGISESTEVYVEDTAAPTVFQGYTLEDMESREGLYYILENGNFETYHAGGFKMWSGMYDGENDTLFMSASRVDRNPVLTNNDTIAVFSSKNISVSFKPIAVTGMTTSVTIDSVNVLLNPIYGNSGLGSSRHYRGILLNDHDEVAVELVPSNEDALFGVELDHISYTQYYMNYGKIASREIIFDSFPKEKEVTISCVEGTKVVQTTKKADYYYFIYGNSYTYYDETLPRPIVDAVPTVEGYAAISMENVPAGQYVLIVYTEDNRYYGTVVTVE